jgi:putative iron-dependent peroxidase
MAIPQTGIFALGDASHTYLEFSVGAGIDPARFVQAVVDIHEPHTTVGGVNLVIGFRPELWRTVAPDDAPAELIGFNEPLRGARGYSMPATQSDAWLWIAGSSYDVVFDLARAAIVTLRPVAKVEREIVGWSYRHSRDLTGFEDGTENPSLMEAPEVATVADGAPGAGGSVLLVQQWRHLADDWSALPQEKQELVIGRTKPDSIELPEDVMPVDAHVPRTTIEEDGKELDIFRRNVAYGAVRDHGTVFVGFGADQHRLDRMLRRMAGAEDGVRDALTTYSTPLTGAYYFVPSLRSLRRFATPESD